ncbi:MAG: HNH endonuclease [Gammaproteobacteria bacterium]|nr:HNH endonuclease [Gammaproteobacteria bacterium]MYF53945.1 HNH endonuclease [Gammaproteobacteria bacterium]MYK44501.1 HNH endonuclease [Gammaproteobacteria bacterium]
MSKLSQKSLIFEYYKNNPDRDIPHSEVVDWATEEWQQRTGKIFRDPDRAIRMLYQEGMLIKVGTGVYRYDPSGVYKPQKDFTTAQRLEILERDEYQCVICGKGKKHGVALHVDHIMPKELGGDATIENGQTLCSQHNMLKKSLKQTETGKKMFIRYYDLARSDQNLKLMEFCRDVLAVYTKHSMNDHIKWDE